jgi:hypothetical protein
MLNFMKAYTISKKFNNLFEGNIIQLGFFDYSNKVLYDVGTVEFENIYKSFIILHSSLKNETVPLKRGEGSDGGNIIIIYDNNEIYKIFINYAMSSSKIGITISDKSNFSITKYYIIENSIEEDFFRIYKTLLKIE